MKTIKLSIALTAVLALMIACSSSNKDAQLSKLKQQQTKINDQILKLQGEISDGKQDTLNPNKFKFVGLKDVKSDKFDHFIRVQGKA